MRLLLLFLSPVSGVPRSRWRPWDNVCNTAQSILQAVSCCKRSTLPPIHSLPLSVAIDCSTAVSAIKLLRTYSRSVVYTPNCNYLPSASLLCAAFPCFCLVGAVGASATSIFLFEKTASHQAVGNVWNVLG